MNSRTHVRVISPEISFLSYIRVYTCQISTPSFTAAQFSRLKTDSASNSYLFNVTSSIHSTLKCGTYPNLATYVETYYVTSHQTCTWTKSWGPLTYTHSRIAVTFHVRVKISNKNIWWSHQSNHMKAKNIPVTLTIHIHESTDTSGKCGGELGGLAGCHTPSLQPILATSFGVNN